MLGRPTATEDLLLQAATRSGPLARAAWERWRVLARLDHVDIAQQRMLPLVHRHFAREGITVEESPYLRKAYDRARLSNRTLFLEMAAAIEALGRAGIPCILLKGAALVTKYYRDPGVRYMGDFDLLIRPERVASAFRSLQTAGFRPIGVPAERGLPVHCERAFESPSGRQLDLHWRLHQSCFRPTVADRLWADAVPMEFQGRRTLALHPAHAFFHVVIHGAKSLEPSPRWVCDALAILDACGAGFDWDRVTALAVDARLVRPFQSALPYLKASFQAPVPEHVLEWCSTQSVSGIERLEHWVERRGWPRRPRVLALPAVLAQYLRWRQDRSLLMSWLDLPRFLYFRFQGAAT